MTRILDIYTKQTNMIDERNRVKLKYHWRVEMAVCSYFPIAPAPVYPRDKSTSNVPNRAIVS